MCSVCYKLNVYTFIKDKIYIRRTLNENYEPKRFNIVNKDNLSAITRDFDYCPFCGDDMSRSQSKVSNMYDHIYSEQDIKKSESIESKVVYKNTDTSLYDVDIDNRTRNLLVKAGYNSVMKVINAGPKSIWFIKGFNPACMDTIIREFSKLGYNMNDFRYNTNV